MITRMYALALFFVAYALPAATLSDAPTVGEFGNWTVHQGAGVCGAAYRKDSGVEIRPGVLLIARKGGLQSAQLRFDNEPFGVARSLSDQERTEATVRITGADFARLTTGITRLRVKIESLTRGTWNVDIDLYGVAEAIAQIKATCS